MTDQDHIERINALTRNARNTWFALLGVLVFVGITLMGVEHIDFYGVNRATKLPLVDVEVPTKSFFFAAPVLTAAIFGYFHLYLIRLWDALGAAPAIVNEQPLGDAIAPWLVTDAALHLRKDDCTTPRTLEGPAMLLNLALAWAFGLGILGWLWIASMPARDIWITGAAAGTLLVSIFAGAASLAMLFLRMRTDQCHSPAQLWSTVPAMASLFVLIPAVVSFSLMRTMGAPDDLAPLDLSDQNLVEKPPAWLPYHIAQKDFLAVWCRRETMANCQDLTEKQQEDFGIEWQTRRHGALTNLVKPIWNKRAVKPNLREAKLGSAFLSGANLSGAQMEGADLSGAQLEGAHLKGALLSRSNLSWAQLNKANLEGAQLQDAYLRRAKLNDARLFKAELGNASLINAEMHRATLSRAQMKGTILHGAKMNNAKLNETKLSGVNLFEAQLNGASFRKAHIHMSLLKKAQMQETKLDFSLWSGSNKRMQIMDKTDFSGSLNHGGAMKYVDLRSALFDSKSDFRNMFFDASVLLPDGFSERMGGLCQRSHNLLDDETFFGRWRGWVESKPTQPIIQDEWRFPESWDGNYGISPPGWEDVTPIPPPEGCEWKTGPMPGATSPD